MAGQLPASCRARTWLAARGGWSTTWRAEPCSWEESVLFSPTIICHTLMSWYPALSGERDEEDGRENQVGAKESESSSQIGNLAQLTDADQKQTVEGNRFLSRLQRLAEALSRYQIEGIGIAPLTLEQRKGRQWWSPGLVWFSANVNGERCACGRERPHTPA